MSDKTKRRTGPTPRLTSPVKFSTQITEAHRDRLFAFAREQGISVAEATRRAIDLLTGHAKR